MKGVFIVFEGIDGCGKSTQLGALRERLQAHGVEPLVIREPGGTPVGEQIREILLERPFEMEPLTELLLYEASRSELTRKVLRPRVGSGPRRARGSLRHGELGVSRVWAGVGLSVSTAIQYDSHGGDRADCNDRSRRSGGRGPHSEEEGV
jgi:hypothetical protein